LSQLFEHPYFATAAGVEAQAVKVGLPAGKTGNRDRR
jgi:hypothetical protein